MRIALCDDEPEQLKQMRSLILGWDECPGDLAVSCYENGDVLLRAHNAAPFDIVFLDVIMPLLNGMEIAKELRKSDKSVKLVFLTSSPDYAVDAFGVKASNYLLKPLDPENYISVSGSFLRNWRLPSGGSASAAPTPCTALPWRISSMWSPRTSGFSSFLPMDRPFSPASRCIPLRTN